jgi:predicted GNAT superfamily acetyltransferase
MPAFWYTNIKINNRPKYKYLKFVKLKEIPEKYKKIDDKGTLLVDNCYIPIDYKKEIAVSNRPIINGILEKGYEITQYKRYEPYINGKAGFARVLIKKT